MNDPSLVMLLKFVEIAFSCFSNVRQSDAVNEIGSADVVNPRKALHSNGNLSSNDSYF